MEAKEIRLGNLIFYPTVDLNTGENVLEIVEATANDIKTQEFKPIFLPIPLTEEWLLKFGFEYHHKLGSRIFYNIGNLFAEICGDGRVAIYGTLKNELICFVSNVHSFQNLFFALTGEELTIK